MLLSSGDNFPHLIQKRRSQLGFVTYLLSYPRNLGHLSDYFMIHACRCIIVGECMTIPLSIPSTERSQENKPTIHLNAVEK